MHELSIAEAIVEGVRRAAAKEGLPARAIRSVQIKAGPMRGIEPEAMAWAWQATTEGTELAGSTIDVQTGPWQLHCAACGAEYESAALDGACVCGAREGCPIGGDELQIVSLDIDDPKEAV